MKQTAVEWLLEQIFKHNNLVKGDGWFYVKPDIIEQAKEMEKEQTKTMYSEEEVTKLLISCKDRFGGSELYDYTHDDEVKEWFEQTKKTFKSE